MMKIKMKLTLLPYVIVLFSVANFCAAANTSTEPLSDDTLSEL